MAEETGNTSGGNGLARIRAILGRKVYGIPVWVFFIMGIMLLAYLLYRRRKAAEASAADSTNGLDKAANQTWPYAAPMNYSSDIFVNTTTENPSPSNTTTPITETVKEGTWLTTFIQQMNAKYPTLGLTEAKLRELNPNIAIVPANSRGYVSSSNPATGNEVPVIHVPNAKTSNQTEQLRVQ